VVSSLDVPITKYVKSVSFLSAEKKLDSISYSCVSCSCCRTVCPVGLSPDLLYNFMVNNLKISEVYKKSSLLCTECGLCNSNCKSRLPLSQTIAVLKKQTEKLGSKDEK
jgi:electron transport complex protein RnfC